MAQSKLLPRSLSLALLLAAFAWSSAQASAPAAPSASAAEVRAAARAANEFGFDLWRRARPTDRNFVLSAWSVNQALAMVSAGARGEADAALGKVLHRSGDRAGWHAALGSLERALTSRGAGKQGKDGGPFRLRAFNQVYAQARLPLERPFSDLLGARYAAAVQRVDFAADAEKARRAINADVSRATESLIAELLAPGTVDATTALVLVNAVYFNAGWATRFKVAATTDRPFFREGGTQAPVKMMSATAIPARVSGRSRGGSPYGAASKPKAGEGDGLEVLQLPYDGAEVALVVLMPPLGKLQQLEQELSAAKLDALLARPAEGATANVKLPRFEVRAPVSLNRALGELGLTPALLPTADFTGMSATRPLFIGQVVHEAVVKTDEAGTEAAAATAVAMSFGGAPSTGEIEVNRPFLFLIRDEATGAVLFLGRFVGP